MGTERGPFAQQSHKRPGPMHWTYDVPRFVYQIHPRQCKRLHKPAIVAIVIVAKASNIGPAVGV